VSRPERGFVALAVAVGVFHHVPAYAGDAGTWIDLATPFAVAAAVVYGLRGAPLPAIVVGTAALVLYIDGHGIHLAANAIGHEDVGAAEDTVDFWDEHWGHAEWHLGWIGLLAALSLADLPHRPSNRVFLGLGGPLIAAAALMGSTLFTSTVEGQDWWLVLGAAPLFVAWSAVRSGRVVAASAAATLLAAALIGIWAAWHGSVPQFSETGWL
jgi:hypothetical protein